MVQVATSYVRTVLTHWRLHRLIGLLLAGAALAGFLATAIGDRQPPTLPHQVLPAPPSVVPQPNGCVADPSGVPLPRDSFGRPLDYWHTCGTRIVDRTGRSVHIAGIAWYGMELAGGAPEGLTVRNYQSILDTVKALGYNVVRIPFSSESIQPGHVPTDIDYTLNPDLRGLTSLQVLDRLVDACQERGLKVILDHHRISPWSTPPLWHDSTYSTDQWIFDWQRLAARYLGDDTVVGFDLQNEPYGATWGTGDPQTDWQIAASQAGNGVLAVNPYLLIFVQGIGTYNQQVYWWGGELQGVATAPVHLNRPGRLVYSPHEYGPSVYPQTWFFTPDYPSNLPAIWQEHWEFIVERGIAPVVVGEVGSPDTSFDVGGTWQRVFLSYLDDHHLGFVAWALNPDAPDTGGVFTPNWKSVNNARQEIYAPYLGSALRN